MWLYKFCRLLNQLALFFGARKSHDMRFRLFVKKGLSAEEFYYCLIPDGYQYNYLSHTYKGQTFTVRMLTCLTHQIHLRLYDDGSVTGHYEYQPEANVQGHLAGVSLRPLTAAERNEIWIALR